MKWQITKLEDGESTMFGNTSKRYWVREYFDDGSEKSGSFYSTLDEAARYIKDTYNET